ETINQHRLRPMLDFQTWKKQELKQFKTTKSQLQRDISKAQTRHQQLSKTVARLQQEVVVLETAQEMQSVGLFEFEHPAQSSTSLATELQVVRTQIKDAIRNKQATSASTTFIFNNS